MAGVSPLTLVSADVSHLKNDTSLAEDVYQGSRKRRRRGGSVNDGLRRLGSRRMRRFVNEMELRRSGGLDREGCDVRELFMVRWRGGFGDLFGAGRETWEAFRNLSEEEQREWLEKVGERKERKGACKEANGGIGKVDGRIKNVLKRRKFLVPVVQKVEERVRVLGPGGRAVFSLGNSVQRLAAHGVAQFYDMRHHSEDREGGTRVTIIQDKSHGKRFLPQVRFADLIAA